MKIWRSIAMQRFRKQVTRADTVMAIAENNLHFIPSIDRYVSLIRAAPEAEDFVNAVREYLASWSTQKIENLQRVDGGWGPFDRYGQVMRLRTVADVSWIGETVRRQIVALKAAGIALNSEIVELDRFFSIARQVSEDRIAIRSREYSGTPRWGDYPQWKKDRSSDRQS